MNHHLVEPCLLGSHGGLKNVADDAWNRRKVVSYSPPGKENLWKCQLHAPSPSKGDDGWL